MHAPIELGPLIHPAGKHSTHRAPKLGLGVLREGLVQLTLDGGLIVCDYGLPVAGGQGRIDRDIKPVLMLVQDFFEHVMVQIEHHIGIHLDKAAIGIKGKTPVARQLGQPLDRGIV